MLKLLSNVPQLENHPVYLSYEGSEDFSECICLPCRSTSQARHSHSSPYSVMTPAKEVVAFLLVKIPFLSVCCTRGNLNARFQSTPLLLFKFFFKKYPFVRTFVFPFIDKLYEIRLQLFFQIFLNSRRKLNFLKISNFNDAYV